MDYFNETVRHRIRVIWSDPTPRAKLRKTGGEGVWPCGDSANRLCELLAGDEMKTVVGTGCSSADDIAMRSMYRNMRSAPGRLIARVQLRHKVAGHAFVWVSREDGTPHTMEGYVYQTNIGIRTQEFDLLEWINDPKSEQSVYFPAYITQLQAAFGKELPGQSGSEGRASVYTDNFLAEGKAIPDATAMKEAPAGEIKILWKAVSDAESLARLLEV